LQVNQIFTGLAIEEHVINTEHYGAPGDTLI